MGSWSLSANTVIYYYIPTCSLPTTVHTDIMLMLKSVWLWIQAVLWPSMSYETRNGLTHASNESVHFQVLGVGLSRTGTFSTRIALTKMLGGKCYHGYVSSLDGEPEFWQKD